MPWIALGIAGAAVVVVLGRRRPLVARRGRAGGRRRRAGRGLGRVLGGADRDRAPTRCSWRCRWSGLLAAGLGVAFRGRGAGPTATLAGAAAVVGWAVLRASVLWMPVLPTDLPAGVDRAVTALALGLAVAGAAAVIVWSGGLAVRRPPAADDRVPDEDARRPARRPWIPPRTRTMPPPPEEGEILGDGGISRPTW